MNVCAEHGKVPKDWRKPITVPTYKGMSDKIICTDYRAISLLSPVGKVYSEILIRKVWNIKEEKI